METSKDFLGNEIKVGDTVAFAAPQYRHLTTGKVIKITPKKVRVEFVNNWNYKPGRPDSAYLECPYVMFVGRPLI